MKPCGHAKGTSAHSLMMTRLAGIFLAFLFPLLALAQGGDVQLRTKADALFTEQRFAEAMPLYSQLVSLSPSDRDLNYRFGTTLLFVGEDKEKAIGHLKFATDAPSIAPAALFWLGRAYHLNYRFADALVAYQRYRGVADKKTLLDLPADAYEQQCRNGQKLLSKLKDITVRSKVEVADTEFFRFYDLSDIGGRIVVTPDELKSSLDKKNKLRSLVYLPDKGGTIFFSSYGKDGRTGLDIYRTELLPDGKFATPEKLAGFINTEFDDDYAFMHPDGKTFYFSSKGHSSMGGYDVFRTTYDPGMDAFGRPENMDFAVNTPDDDIFYMVDAEQKEACFASGRSSRQGKLHVYRVATTQTPLIITVLRGTYSSEFDANDRKARIVVEDALTREQVADVRTDINGSYVLALPRSGKFRFLVECGPTGKTHSGTVDVPRSDSPKAYRQELTLTKQGDLERLMIRNYFDEPLDGDIIAMALEEIKRRARLDVTGESAPVVQAPVQEEPKDVLTQAGFAGNVDRAGVMELAQEDATALNAEVQELEDISAAAYSLALDAVTEAERATKDAEALVAKAAIQSDEAERNATMVQAALMRQRARDAELRAQAAYRTGKVADDEHLAKRQQALEADKLATDIRRTMSAQRDAEALPYLTKLKERLDHKSGPTGRMDIAERTRRSVGEQEKEVARMMQQANAKRTEESELTDRMNRLRREQAESRSKSRKDELGKELETYQEQLRYLNKETEEAFAKARVLERETAVLRGNAGLTKHLVTTGATAGTTLETDQIAALERRLSTTRSRTDALAIDERFDAQIPLRASDREGRSFAWDRSAAAAWEETERSATLAMQRNTEQDAARMDGRTSAVPGGEDRARALGEAEVDSAVADARTGGGDERDETESSVDDTVLNVPKRATTDEPRDGSTADDSAQRAGSAGGSATLAKTGQGASEVREGAAEDAERVRTTDLDQGQGAVRTSAAGTSGEGTRSASGVDPAVRTSAPEEQDGNRGSSADATLNGIEGRVERNGTEVSLDNTTDDTSTIRGSSTEVPRTADLAGRGATTDGAASTSGQQRDTEDVPLTPEQIRNAATDDDRAKDPDQAVATDDGTDTFLLENRIAELRQLAGVERDRSKADSLRALIAELDAELMEREAAILAKAQATDRPTTEIPEREELLSSISSDDAGRAPLTFDNRTEDSAIIATLFADHAADERRLLQLPDADERAAGLHGLELMLADSIRAEMARQVAILELDPLQAERVLPRVDRLRQLRAARLELAEEHLRQREAELMAEAGERPTAGGTSSRAASAGGVLTGEDPINDRFVVIEADTRDIYASTLVHRSPNVSEALVQKEAELARMDDLAQRIDSLQMKANEMPRTRERDRVVKSMDRLKDDLLITRTDLGQRSAYLSKQEWSVATDSLSTLEKGIIKKGAPPTEPLLVMQRNMKSEAQAMMKEAEGLRKKADRTEDIILRDSLYRQAYELELRSLREVDRSITVANYLLSEKHARGETLAYNTVAARLFGITEVDELAGGRMATLPTVRASEAGTPPPASAGVEADRNSDTIPAREAEEPTTMDVADGRVLRNDGEPRATTDAEPTVRAAQEAVAVAPATAPSATTPAQQPDLARARADAEELARREEAGMDEKARRPAGLYEQLLSSEQSSVQVDPATSMDDGSVLALELMQAAARVREQEEQALALSDRATQLEDSAATAKKRDRQRMETMAVRLRMESDSLQGMALRGAEDVRRAERALVVEQQEQELRKRLVKFYYLSTDEQSMVLDDTDRSRYFMARTKALEQYDAAADATEAARTNRTLGEALKQRTAQAPVGDGPARAAERNAANAVLLARAEALLARADSLDDVARRLKGAAAINESQAAVMLQAADEEDATALMALEMRTRRTEPLLAVARGQAGTQPGNENSEPVAPAATSAQVDRGTAPTTAMPDAPSGIDRSADAIATMDRRNPASIAPAIPIPAKLVTDIFELRPVTERRAAPIAMDAEMPQGIVFKVQIGAFRNAIPEETFSDMTPVMGESVGNGLVRYTAGLFTTFDQAAGAKDQVRDRGYRDAFVVAYRDGKRIPLGEAMREVRSMQDVAAVAATPAAVPSERGSTLSPGSTAVQVPAVPVVPAETTPQPPRTVEPVPVPVTATIERPSAVVVPTPSREEEVAVILAKYPASVTEIVDRFVPVERAADYYNVPGAAPARQVETIKGLFFTVQVGVYSKPVALDKLFNITPLNSERTETGNIRYTTGLFFDTEEARIRKDGTVQLGVKDAFVTAYLNGKRIPMREAAALLERFGPGILAKP